MADLLDAAREIDGFCRRQGWRYVYANLEPLAAVKEQPELITQLRTLECKWRQTE